MGPVDYSKNAYCCDCETKWPKQLIRCPNCKQRLRHKPAGNLYRTRYMLGKYQALPEE